MLYCIQWTYRFRAGTYVVRVQLSSQLTKMEAYNCIDYLICYIIFSACTITSYKCRSLRFYPPTDTKSLSIFFSWCFMRVHARIPTSVVYCWLMSSSVAAAWNTVPVGTRMTPPLTPSSLTGESKWDTRCVCIPLSPCCQITVKISQQAIDNFMLPCQN